MNLPFCVATFQQRMHTVSKSYLSVELLLDLELPITYKEPINPRVQSDAVDVIVRRNFMKAITSLLAIMLWNICFTEDDVYVSDINITIPSLFC